MSHTQTICSKHIAYEIYANLFINSNILKCFRKNMAKTSTFKTFIETYEFTSHNGFQANCHNIQIYLTYATIFFLNPHWSNNCVNLLAKAWLIVSVASNKPTVTCLGYQSYIIKLITRANISCAPLEIHKSKLVT